LGCKVIERAFQKLKRAFEEKQIRRRWMIAFGALQSTIFVTLYRRYFVKDTFHRNRSEATF